MTKTLTLLEASERWIGQFNQVPASVLEKMAQSDASMRCYDSDSLRLLASPLILCGECGAAYEGQSTLKQLAAKPEACPFCRPKGAHLWIAGLPSQFPCSWATLWAPRHAVDQQWILEQAQCVAQLGLFVFESQDYGCLLGVDGAGFDFYESFWVPLYQMRGLEWHLQSRPRA